MYQNVGKKILTLANTLCIIGIVISCIAGLAILVSDEDMFLVGLLAAGLGSLSSWLGSLLLAGFGELLVTTSEIRDMMAASKSTASPASPSVYNSDL